MYRAARAAPEKAPGMQRKKLLEGYRTEAIGADANRVRCHGKWIPLGVSNKQDFALTPLYTVGRVLRVLRRPTWS